MTEVTCYGFRDVTDVDAAEPPLRGEEWDEVVVVNQKGDLPQHGQPHHLLFQRHLAQG